MKSLETVSSEMKSRTENQQYSYVEGQQSLEDVGRLSGAKQIWRFLRID